MTIERFDYDLPASSIAQTPIEPRDAARLLVARSAAPVAHRRIADLPDLLEPGDLLVVNETRVRPARLRLKKPTGGVVEVLLLDRAPEGWWSALVRPSRRVAVGTVLAASETLEVEIGAALDGGRRAVRLRAAGDEEAALATAGTLPLPPYISTPLADPDRYQTVFAAATGSAAAPTAGLHLTHEVLDRCRARGIGVATVDLRIGLDTFRPITTERPEDHVMHTEHYRVPDEAMAACEAAPRVVAVGTTTVRALESAAATGTLEGCTDLFIHDDHRFRVVDTLLTNFHLPRSTLLVLLDAFMAGGCWRDLYDLALRDGYRFLSFGDAMLVDRGACREGNVG